MAKDDSDADLPLCRVLTSFLLPVAYIALITACLFRSFDDAGEGGDARLQAGFGTLTALSFLVQFVVLGFSLTRRYMKSVNISLLTFTLFTMIQYGFGLYYSHRNVDNKPGQDRSSCVNLKSDMFSYGVYLTTFPMMVISNILYPFPSAESGEWTRSVQNGLMTLDLLDMAELIFSDIGCYIGYDDGWLVVFFIAIGASAILATISRGLEQPTEDGEEKTGFDSAVTIFNMIFNDGLFCFLRLYVMFTEGHVYFGLIFVIKEICSFIFRLMLLCSKKNE